jgi:hypothetical protein
MTLTVTLPARIATRLRALATEHGTTVEALAVDAVGLLVGAAVIAADETNERTNERTNASARPAWQFPDACVE